MNAIRRHIKPKSIGLVIGLIWVMLSCFAIDSAPTQTVGELMQQGEARQLVAYFETDIELRIDPVDVDFASVRTDQAELIMRSFFKKYPPRLFQTTSEGTTAHLRYTTGTYWSGSQPFRVNVLMRRSTSGQYRIYAIRVSD